MSIEFVPYHLALELKQLGFDEECSGYYDVDNGYTAGYAFCYSDVETQPEKGCSAPKFQQAFQWFREKYNLIPAMQSIVDEKVGLRFYYSIEKYGDNWEDIVPNSELYTKYGEAELACLKKLIEIANTEEK